MKNVFKQLKQSPSLKAGGLTTKSHNIAIINLKETDK